MVSKSNGSRFSQFGQKLTGESGILELMDDLGRAMTLDPRMRMLGGGNPAAVPEMQRLIRERMIEMLADGDSFERTLLHYDPPRGNPHFIAALAGLLKREFGWNIGPENIAVTSGGQSACFYLFNLLAGNVGNGRLRKILLPLAPEYIGYADQGITPELFVSCKPAIEWPAGKDSRIFKYRVDFAAVERMLDIEDIGAIAASRPTNPTGNVLSDDEVLHLSALAKNRGIPLMLDNAYGAPFPDVMFTPAKPHWAPHMILTLSLSKLGLPGARTGIVIAPPEIASAVASLTAIIGLANGTLGQQIVLPWIENGEILKAGKNILRPFYLARSLAAMACAREVFSKAGVEWAIHASEGAFFLWLWLPKLSITSRELYERLKKRHVLTVPGEYFFYGLPEEWHHRRECLRLNFSQSEEVVSEGLQIIAEEAAKAQL